MPTLHFIAKAVNPEELGWRQRIARQEGPLRQAFLDWVAAIQAQIDVAQIAHAIISRGASIFDHVVQAIEFQPVLAPVAEREAVRAFDQLAHELAPTLHLSFNLRDPNFQAAVQAHQARLVREVTDETRRNIANLIGRAYTNGVHPYNLAPQIKAMVGLTSRQGQAVFNYLAAQSARGVSADVVAARTDRYAARMLTRRAQTVARTETARAAVLGRLQSYEQAATANLFDPATAELEWSSVQTDPNEICAQLDGERVAYGSDFQGLLPPAHPSCRCSVHLVL